jgi:hypothetical protein
MDALSGFIPEAMYSAADFRVASSRSFGSCGRVMACRSTTQKNVSAKHRGDKKGKLHRKVFWSDEGEYCVGRAHHTAPAS